MAGDVSKLLTNASQDDSKELKTTFSGYEKWYRQTEDHEIDTTLASPQMF